MTSAKILEKEKRFSESLLWTLQQQAYTQFGPQAWSQKGVPFYLTGNPFTAKNYAHVVLGYLRDGLSNRLIDPSFPIYLLDLGAGTGRFGFLFLKEFLPMIKEIFSDRLSICYVMTDIVSDNLSFCENHSYLQSYIKDGVLDFAYYHHEDYDKPVTLLKSQKTLSSKTTHNPLILIANYFFDTIPQDLFRIQNGVLEEGKVTLSIPKQKETKNLSMTDPAHIQYLQCHYTYTPIKNPESYYPKNPKLNEILKTYSQSLNNAPFLFPIGAFQSLNYFSKISRGRLFLIAGDQGVCTEAQIQNWGEPKIALHGTFSVSVSYHSLAQYFQKQKGVGLLTTFSDPAFVVISGILGGKSADYNETRLAFQTHIDAFEPYDYWKIVDSIQEWPSPSLVFLLELIKLGNWDPMNLNAFYEIIRKKIASATESQKELLRQTIHKVWENYYPISKEEGDFILNLGVLFFEMKQYEEALTYFERSLTITGDQESTFKNIAACYISLNDQKNATKYLKKCQE